MKETISKIFISLIIIANIFATPSLFATATPTLLDTSTSIQKHSTCCGNSGRSCCCTKTCTCKVHKSTSKHDNSPKAVTVAEIKILIQEIFYPVYIPEYQNLIIEKKSINIVEKLKPPNIIQNIESIVIIC